jgi:hypothetical protein
LALCRIECYTTAKRLNYIVKVQIEQEPVKYTAAGSHDQSTLAIKEDTGADDGKKIKEREDAFYTSSCINNSCGENCIQKKLDISQFDEVLLKFKKNRIDKGKEIDGGNNKIMECLNIPEIGLCLLYLDQYGYT